MAPYTAEAPRSERQPVNRRVVPALPLSVVRNQKSKKQPPSQQSAPATEAQVQESHLSSPTAQNGAMSSTATGVNTPESAPSRTSIEPSSIQSPAEQTPTSPPSAVTAEDNATGMLLPSFSQESYIRLTAEL